MITRKLIHLIVNHYPQSPYGRHGIAHWARVLEAGRELALINGAVPEVVELFAVFHDAKRETETKDPGHGARGAAFARQLHGTYFQLNQDHLDLLCDACQYHTDGLTEGDITLRTCWDADRLDLGRAMIKPVPHKLCTDAAVSMIETSHHKSCSNYLSPIIQNEWGLTMGKNQ